MEQDEKFQVGESFVMRHGKRQTKAMVVVVELL